MVDGNSLKVQTESSLIAVKLEVYLGCKKMFIRKIPFVVEVIMAFRI